MNRYQGVGGVHGNHILWALRVRAHVPRHWVVRTWAMGASFRNGSGGGGHPPESFIRNHYVNLRSVSGGGGGQGGSHDPEIHIS